ncbi:uncharacterized protein TNIN_351741 [Trichonephila inaurata madagascariensis]|uniref:Uncharacterized protein n=1 Tax=Trichonephila inaurata madagascariensis TaxID=2747483 RepID=A0A8X7CBX2_9ARAC|nr:uncharacterized protein TNIN_351741 [Trichonephila inaurata madagascariensis]
MSTIPDVHKCCFIVKLEDATALIGFMALGWSIAGGISSILNMSELYHAPEHPVARSVLQVIFCLGMQGMVFHCILFLISVTLVIGVLTDNPPLLIPWIAGVPFFIIAIVINVGFVIKSDPILAIPVACFALILILILIYATLIVVLMFKELIKYETRRSFLEGLTNLRPGKQYSAHFDKDKETVYVVQTSEDLSADQPSTSRSFQQPRKDNGSEVLEGQIESYLRKGLDVSSAKVFNEYF